jgi:soluble lytic murein transglycosylase
VALVGSISLTPKVTGLFKEWFGLNQPEVSNLSKEDQKSEVLILASFSPQERDPRLREIATGKKSLERSRARYLLASDFVDQYEGGLAILQLENLDQDFPLLAPHILLKRGRAYELTNENAKAKETWQQLVTQYPDALVTAEALYLLGRSDSQYWDQAIAQFPQHPRSQEIARKRLQENPNQVKLLLLLAKYASSDPGTASIRDRLVNEFSAQLTPEDWQVVADGYWDSWQYLKAGLAYAKAPKTAQNVYRHARGLHIGGRQQEAIKIYQTLIQEFPEAEDTGLGLRRLASISPSREALGYLDRVINNFPKEAPQALLDKAKILENLKDGKGAAQARQRLLDEFPKSEVTAEYRWNVAQKKAASGDLVEAWKWARAITVDVPDSNLAPRAAFWIGKWALQLNRQEEAQATFKHILTNYTHSYYAWRSAVLLGWDVGDFTTVRKKNPSIDQPNYRFIPPGGSDVFQELYRLGQNQDAWLLFQAEIGDRRELTVAEQFTEGLLKLAKNQNLNGINHISDLRNREDPQDQTEWQALRQTPEYWQALFPFPYQDKIFTWSEKRDLNPLLVTGLIRQESRFESEIRSSAGATGLMQVMPATGEWIAGKIGLKEYNLTDPNDNINLGTWYLDHTHEEYNNNTLLAVASYNAGPGNVANWLKRYGFNDPDVFVEQIPFPETKGYVEAVLGNYWNYLRIYNPEIAGLINNL